MKRQKPQAGWAFWPSWTAATAVGAAAGAPLGFAVAVLLLGLAEPLVGSLSTGAFTLVIAAPQAVLGAVVGAGQWLVLRRYVVGAGWWVAASAVGGTVGGVVGALAVPPGLRLFGAVSSGVALGAAVGIAQWLVLQPRLPRAIWWVPASIIGFALGGAWRSEAPGLGSIIGGAVLSIGVSWAVAGAVTGAVLAWLLSPPARARLRLALLLGAVLVATGAPIAAGQSLYNLDGSRFAVVHEFGEVIQVQAAPGTYWKVPFLQQATYLDRGVQQSQSEQTFVIPGAQARVVFLAEWRIREGEAASFFRAVHREGRGHPAMDYMGTGLEVVNHTVSLAVAANVAAPLDSRDAWQAKLPAIREAAQRGLDEAGLGVEILDLRLQSVGP